MPSYAGTATYCDFNIRADCPPAVADVEFPLEEIKIACLKDMAPFSNEPEELKHAMLTSCIGYARTRFEITHQWKNEEMKISAATIFILFLAATAANAEQPIVAEFSCFDIVNGGWGHMPDVTDYVLAKPHSDKLGYGSPCHINSLVFAQCFAEPKWSVREAVNALIRKATTGKTLPDVPVCGA
jgi:hypothetical protein